MSQRSNDPPDTAPSHDTGSDAKPVRRRTSWQRGLVAAIVLYAITIFGLAVWMRLRGDRAWLATLFLFGPRWICAVPMLVLVPLAAVWFRRGLGLLAIIGVVIAGPIMGFQLHLFNDSAPFKLRVLTCNVAQRDYRVADLASLIDELRPDVVALQEVKLVPPKLVWPEGWHVVFNDELLVACRYPIWQRGTVRRPTVPGKLAAIRYQIQFPGRDVQLFNLHLMTPRPGLEAVLDRKRGVDLSGIPRLNAILRKRDEETKFVGQWVDSFPEPKIIVGDFNMPVESTIYRRYWSSMRNAFSTTGFGLGFTKMTEKRGWTYGARIDHILYSPPWHCVRAWVGPDIGSDHRPLVADFD